MNKPIKSVLILSIAANAVLFACFAAGYISLDKSSAAGAQPKSADSSALSSEAAKATEALLAMDDMAALRDKLRALGLPDATVKEIVGARIASRYTATLRDIGNAALEAARQRSYWGRDRNYMGGLVGYSDDQNQKMREIDGEKERESTRLFGADKNAGWASYYEYLSAEKAAKLGEMERDYDVMRSQAVREMAGFQMPGDAEKIKLLDEEKKRDTLALLTPEEKEASELRDSYTARGLQRTFAAFDGTEEEYKAIFALQNALDEKYPREWVSLQAAAGSNGVEDFQKARAEEQKNIDAQIKDMLGDERYADYVRGQRQDYQTLQAAAERFNLSDETVAQTYQVRDDTANEAKRISDDPSLNVEQRNAAFAELAAQATAQIKASLGDDVGDAYITNALPWLTNLPKGRKVIVGPKGNVTVIQKAGRAGQAAQVQDGE